MDRTNPSEGFDPSSTLGGGTAGTERRTSYWAHNPVLQCEVGSIPSPATNTRVLRDFRQEPSKLFDSVRVRAWVLERGHNTTVVC